MPNTSNNLFLDQSLGMNISYMYSFINLFSFKRNK
jgi:hypothetical protein